ncbi:P-loop containing nucleoside triphosphate hydrolase protein [Rhizoclosmatium globosum]|uniref:p-loop containing nucleoside triphosphate hydrolase protein n=1 Tax=Rhizoclosmatium globosum TaxID=329046 RepID=A0A1Y2D388_9FUNG|nr:P-loop containing nucleoside triphosphate hydrolase protein [Rhizoclosmatium globosum]|eukprot:ORY53742.1 P-loop containing nucleoside triphosphate hydrolase protein [Rhizoclosmatium globosum]
MTTPQVPQPAAENVILVLSGKGGVGKSTVSTSLSLALAMGGGSSKAPSSSVGILDIDLTGPSVPRILQGWVPVQVPLPKKGDGEKQGSLGCMSIGFLLKDKGDAVIWRGPKKTAMIRQFLQDVDWGKEKLDYLIVDTPPGTGDEHIALVENLREGWNVTGAVLVTTPQDVSIADVRKELSFCNKVGIKVLGIVENMSGYVCPHCAECTNLFSKGGGEALAKEHNLPFLGYIPIDPSLVSMIESSVPVEDGSEGDNTVGGYVVGFPKSGVYDVFQEVTSKIVDTINNQNAAVSSK